MLIKKYDLKKEYKLSGSVEGLLTAYVCDNGENIAINPRPAILVIPGGGYRFVSEREGEPVALDFYNRGYNAFVLNYSVSPCLYPAQLNEASCAVDFIKKNAEKFNIYPDKVFAVGFSAGGHLTGCLLNAQKEHLLKGLDCRLTAGALCYPVINRNLGDWDSFGALLGASEGQDWLDLDKSVTHDNPPAFIWTTAADTGVPAINALSYAAAYAKNNVKYELHVFAEGEHGLSLCDERTSCGNAAMVNAAAACWPAMADRFFTYVGQTRNGAT